MINKITSKYINNNITYVLRYYNNEITCQVRIFNKVFNSDSMLSENQIKRWIHDIILKESGIEYTVYD